MRLTPPTPPAYGEQDPNGYRTSPPPDGITPYLGLRSRLSQVWINRWTILLLLILARLLIAIGSLDGNLASAKREALSACTNVESMGSAMASMPHYMSRGVNEMTATGVEKAVNGLMSMLELTVTGVEEIIIFFINMMTQTYLCLITLVVTGAINVALDVLKKATEFIEEATNKIGDAIGDGIEGFQKKANDVVGAINNFLGGKLPPLNLDGPIKDLRDLSLPGDFTKELDKLKENIPNFEDVNNFTQTALRTPFELVKKLIRDEIGEFEFDRSLFPVPQKEKLSFCGEDDGINTFFDKLTSLIEHAQKIFIGVLVVSAILVCVPMAYREIRSWRAMKERCKLLDDRRRDPMDVVYAISRPFTSKTGTYAGNWFGSERRKVLVRWVFAYVTSPPALFLLSLGIAGLFSCACQFILLESVKKEVPGLTDHVSKFAEKVVLSLNNASEQWAVGTNRVIDDKNNEINERVFGWVNDTTSSVNDTLNVFVDETSDILNKTFGGTILYDPIKEVLNCLIGLKIQGIQRGLTWVSNHAHVDFPNMPNDTFSLRALEDRARGNDSDSESFLANPGDKTADKISETVLRVTNSIENGIRVEAIISAVIISIWFFVLLLAIIRALTLWFGPDKTRGDGNGDSELPYPTAMSGAPHDLRDVPLRTPLHETYAPAYTTEPHSTVRGFNQAYDADDDYYYKEHGAEREVQRADVAHARKSSQGEVGYVYDEKR
ncbi:hypothetical protein AJ79_08791 [Helicocarpus griseus UAMH5409]|uniref:Plasma membrane fusion protein PRM1 n=1 Tax=Helicocarpus griseus UAMH5409 TaxID=1447875 RepID=A0A2B7WPW2_9EURO|nr:hypothetical protein AJ79_08791 [Helicocarpus griseus UAMH5409]